MAISAGELQTAFGDEASHLTYVQNIALKVSADPAVMAADAVMKLQRENRAAVVSQWDVSNGSALMR